jgi:sirohydrochlorin cobaltochelatase
MKRLLIAFVLCCALSTASFAAEAKQALILAAFGTSEPAATVALSDIGKAYTENGNSIIWAYSSNIIRNKLASQGKQVYSVGEAMDKAAAQGTTELTIQSLHIVPAEEYVKIQRQIIQNLCAKPKRFTSVRLGHPLLESARDQQEVLQALLQGLPAQRRPSDGVIFMGHGNDRGAGDLILDSMARALHEKDKHIWLATVEGAQSFDRVLPQLTAAGIQRVWLVPFMLVAGDHARNDMAGDDADSWASRLKAAGIEAHAVLAGLGSNKGIQQIFLRHTKDAADDLVSGKQTRD